MAVKKYSYERDRKVLCSPHTGGFKDWFIDKFRRPGFTVEIGIGKNPLPPERADSIYRQIKEMLSLYIIM